MTFHRTPLDEPPPADDPAWLRALILTCNVAAGFAIFVLLPVSVAVWRGWL